MSKSAQFPTILILFGITGDLAKKKVIPAIYHLYKKGYLPTMFSVVGFSRREWSDTALKSYIVETLAEHKDISPKKEELEQFLNIFSYEQGNFDQIEGYTDLAESLGLKDKTWNTCANKLFYLSVPPKYYSNILDNLSKSELTKPCSPEEGWTRVIVEKPFGQNYQTAQELDKMLGKLFEEKQIYRIDHYLGKETMQNILAFRFSNNLLEKTWNRDSIEQIKIRFIEKMGLEGRGDFYDEVGALRDVGQNHVLQMLALTTMEHPGTFEDGEIRKSRENLLESLNTLSENEIEQKTFRAQFSQYKAAEGVDNNSNTETYFKIVTQLKSARWHGVPITLEGGKAMGHARKEIKLIYRHSEPCYCPPNSDHNFKNRVVISLNEPNEGIEIRFWAKKPGLTSEIEERKFTFNFSDSAETAAEAYEKLLLDCIEGNQDSFLSTNEVAAMWKFVDPIVEGWEKNLVQLKQYKAGDSNIMKEPNF